MAGPLRRGGEVLIPHIADDSHRLSILTLQEIEDLYGLPRFAEILAQRGMCTVEEHDDE